MCAPILVHMERHELCGESKMFSKQEPIKRYTIQVKVNSQNDLGSVQLGFIGVLRVTCKMAV